MSNRRSIILVVALFVLSLTAGFVAVSIPQVDAPTDGHLEGEGYWDAKTLPEARDLAGFMPTLPRFLPEGMEVQTIHVTNMDVGGPFIVVDIYLNYRGTDDLGLIFTQTNRPFSSEGQAPVIINGLNYSRGQATDDRPATLSWSQDGYQYELAGYLNENLTETTLAQVAGSLR